MQPKCRLLLWKKWEILWKCPCLRKSETGAFFYFCVTPMQSQSRAVFFLETTWSCSHSCDNNFFCKKWTFQKKCYYFFTNNLSEEIFYPEDDVAKAIIIDILFLKKCDEIVATLRILHVFFLLQISTFIILVDSSEYTIIIEDSISCGKGEECEGISYRKRDFSVATFFFIFLVTNIK